MHGAGSGPIDVVERFGQPGGGLKARAVARSPMFDAVSGQLLHPQRIVAVTYTAQMRAADYRVKAIDAERTARVAENVGKSGVCAAQQNRGAFVRLHQ